VLQSCLKYVFKRLNTPAIKEDVHPFTLQAYEDMLTLAWEAFYTSNAQKAVSAVDHWMLFLKEQINLVDTMTSRKRILTFLCRFLQLRSVLARDRIDFPYAFSSIYEAIALAFQLEDVELIASSLYRRAKLYAAQQHYELAVPDLEATLPYARRSQSPLRCYISMFLAEVYSLFAPQNKEFFQKSLEHLDRVDRDVREKDVLEGDGSFVKVDTSGLYMIRGDVLRRNGEIHEAHNALNIVRESLPKEFTRWQGNLNLSTSQLFLAEGDVTNSCKQIHNALDIFQATGSRCGLAKTQRIYQTIHNAEPEHSEVKELGIRLSIL
jgi:tetratricopeptide (TPR) repeat protein